MRAEQAIQDRIRSLLTQELERRVSAANARIPRHCEHNYQHPLDTRKQINGEPNENYNRIAQGTHLPVLQTIGLCKLGSNNPEEWGGTICEEAIDAQRCPLFKPKDSREVIQKRLEAHLRDAQWVKENLPEVNGLLWAINTENLPEPEPEPVSLPWWKRFLLRWMGLSPKALPAKGL